LRSLNKVIIAILILLAKALATRDAYQATIARLSYSLA